MTASKQSQDGTAEHFHPDSAWKRSSKTCMKPMLNVQYRNPDDRQRGSPKHVEFCDGINLDN